VYWRKSGLNAMGNIVYSSYYVLIILEVRLERLNLTFRQDNNRISRKTIGFSKELFGLDDQMMLYCANFNFCRPHLSLSYVDNSGKKKLNCPAKEYGLIKHNWSLKELLTFPYHKTSTN